MQLYLLSFKCTDFFVDRMLRAQIVHCFFPEEKNFLNLGGKKTPKKTSLNNINTVLNKLINSWIHVPF